MSRSKDRLAKLEAARPESRGPFEIIRQIVDRANGELVEVGRIVRRFDK